MKTTILATLLTAMLATSGTVVAATPEAKALYKQSNDKAELDYKAARMKIADAYFDLDKAKCNGLTGNEKDVCVQRAKATLVAARSDAKADRKTIEARADARDDKRDAEYKVAREKCDAFAGDVKDSCVASAKAQFGK